MSDPRYPTGTFKYVPQTSMDSRRHDIARIQSLPAKVRQAVTGLDESALRRAYRDDGWTIRQLVHHLPDSHMNGYIRFKLALTEDTPTIKPYDENAWATLRDVRETAIEVSLSLLEAIHVRWTAILESMNDADFAREYVHPEHGRKFTLDEALQSYAWHGDHHLAHIMVAKQR